MYNIEIQAINLILGSQSLDILTKEGVESSYFLANKEHIQFILNHHEQYGVVPSVVTFSNTFKDFPIFEVKESPAYLADKLKESTLFQKVVPIVNTFRDKMQKDSVDATTYLLDALQDAKSQIQFNKSIGTDIIAQAKERYADYQNRVSVGGLLGITTGVRELDKATFGWLPEDHIVLFARTNEGKSWIAEYLAVQAWKSGKKVLYYAGEMTPLMLGYRFDTLYKNISNTAMLMGNEQLQDSYLEYIYTLAEGSGFYVVTPTDFGGKKPTIAQIESVVQDLGVDIVFLDQLSLLDDGKHSDNKVARYGNISQDIMLASKRLQIPFITVAQANRDAEKDKKAKEDAPQLHHVEYSDALVQDATRVISLKYDNGLLKLSLKKNRFGGRNVDVLLKWDIDRGIIEPMLNDDELEQLGEDYGF